jgi:hypothetical protein
VIAAGGIAAAVMASGDDPQPCGTVQRGVLPEWARTGFSDPEPRIAHVMGRSGRITAILFGEPLQAGSGPDRRNKILWVARDAVQPLSDLVIDARAGDGRRARRVVAGGPGPSGIELPAGCWHITLRWSGRQDSLDLRYVR